MEDWKIFNTARPDEAVTGTEEYVRTVAKALDNVTPPIDYKIEGPTA